MTSGTGTTQFVPSSHAPPRWMTVPWSPLEGGAAWALPAMSATTANKPTNRRTAKCYRGSPRLVAEVDEPWAGNVQTPE